MHFGVLFSFIDYMRKSLFLFLVFKSLEPLFFFFHTSGLDKLALPGNRAVLFSLRLVNTHKQYLYIPPLYNRQKHSI